MKKFLKFTALSVVLLVLAGVATSCNDKEKKKSLLASTQWKLMGIVDEETGKLREIVAPLCNEDCSCYVLVFGSACTFSTEQAQGTFSSRTHMNVFCGGYVFDNKPNRFRIVSFGGTQVYEFGDPHLYYSAFKARFQPFFVLENGSLWLYNGENRRLLFKKKLQNKL